MFYENIRDVPRLQYQAMGRFIGLSFPFIFRGGEAWYKLSSSSEGTLRKKKKKVQALPYHGIRIAGETVEEVCTTTGGGSDL